MRTTMIEPKDRFSCAVTTLYMMLVNEKWYQAQQIVLCEIEWGTDPQPPGIENRVHDGCCGWARIYEVLRKKCNEH